MRNVKLAVEGKLLLITVDLSKDFGESKSGKSITIASTDGNVDPLDGLMGKKGWADKLPKDMRLGLNVYKTK